MTKKLILFALACISAVLALLSPQMKLGAQQPPTPVLINNVRIFDGISDQLLSGNVLLVNRKIEQISSSPITAPEQKNDTLTFCATDTPPAQKELPCSPADV